MNTGFTARHFDPSQSLKDYALESVKKLERYYDGILDCDIILEPYSDPASPQRAEIKLTVRGDIIKAAETAESYEQAIIRAVDNVKRQLIKFKNKKQAKT